MKNFILKFFAKKSLGVNNNHGGAMLVAMGVSVATIMSVVLAQKVSRNMTQVNTSQRDTAERDRVFVSTKALFSDQRFCQQFFTSGFSTAAGDYYIDNVNSNFAKKRLEELDTHFTQYKPVLVTLKNGQNLADDENGAKYKRFGMTVTVAPKDQNSNSVAGLYGLKKNQADSRDLKLVLSNNGRCFLDSYDAGVSENTGTSASCKALGGTYSDGRCHMKQFKSPYDGFIDTSKVELDKSMFSGALCELELSALRKLGPHLINQSATRNMANGWTSLCAKPKWSGCRASNDIDRLIKEGNDPRSNNLKKTGDSWSVRKTMNSKKFKKFAEQATQPTMARRFNRVTGVLMSEQSRGVAKDLGDTGADFEDRLKTAGRALGIPTTLVSASSAALLGGSLSAAWMGGPAGVGLAATIALIAPKCNKLRATVNFQCTEGFSEVSSIKYETQKLKIKLSGFKCKWRNRGTLNVPTDQQLYANLKQNIRYDADSNDLLADEVSNDDLIEVLAKLRDPNLTFDQLIDMFSDEASDPDEEAVLGIPAVLLDTILSKEYALWNKTSQDLAALLVQAMVPPRAQGPAETPEQYAAFLDNFYNGKNDGMATMKAKMDKYLEFSKNIKDAQGNDRNFSGTPVYGNIISPLADRINSAAVTIKRRADTLSIELKTPIATVSLL